MSNLRLIRGDSVTLEIVVTRKVNDVITPVDITGALIWLTIKAKITDEDVAALIRKGTGGTGLTGITITSPANGRAVATITAADTAIFPTRTSFYWFDVQLKEVDGTITTVDRGRCAVVSDVTRTTS